MKNKLYDTVFDLLKRKPELRNSDKLLIWDVLKMQRLINAKSDALFGTYEFITKDAFMNSKVNFETIRRTRQKIQEDHPELAPSITVKNYRNGRQLKGKYFVYHESLL